MTETCQLKLPPCGCDVIDNLGRTSPRELTYGVEHLEVGQRFMSIFSLTSFAHDQHITLSSRRTAVTYAVLPGDGLTRLVARVLFGPPEITLALRSQAKRLPHRPARWLVEVRDGASWLIG